MFEQDPLLFRLEENYRAAERMLSNPWWESEYDDLFDPAFTVDLPFAPPGMDQHLGIGQLLPHKEWLCRTVSNWYVKDMKLYLELDDYGFIRRYDETLNPINKMNSINKPLPAFPYMY